MTKERRERMERMERTGQEGKEGNEGKKGVGEAKEEKQKDTRGKNRLKIQGSWSEKKKLRSLTRARQHTQDNEAKLDQHGLA